MAHSNWVKGKGNLWLEAKFYLLFDFQNYCAKKMNKSPGTKQERGCVYVAEEIIKFFTKWSSLKLSP